MWAAVARPRLATRYIHQSGLVQNWTRSFTPKQRSSLGPKTTQSTVPQIVRVTPESMRHEMGFWFTNLLKPTLTTNCTASIGTRMDAEAKVKAPKLSKEPVMNCARQSDESREERKGRGGQRKGRRGEATG